MNPTPDMGRFGKAPSKGRPVTTETTTQPSKGAVMATLNLRQAARAEWEASESDRIAAARTALGAVIGAENATAEALDVVEVVDFTGGYTVAFVDAEGVHVAVTVRSSGSEVRLVRHADDGTWTSLGKVDSLAHLWELIDEHLPPAEPAPTYPAWVQPTGAHDAYALNDRVTWNGKVWESTVNGNVWEPGVSGWREVVA